MSHPPSDHSSDGDREAASSVDDLGYLTRLTLSLATGAAGLPDEALRPHREFIAAAQREDGGWSGREGQSDPYYTAFGLRGLWIAGGLESDVASRAAGYLRSAMTTRQSVVDLMSLIFAAAILEIAAGEVVIGDDDQWAGRVADLMLSMRTEDGGFAKTPEGRAGSTYQTFLSALCFELLGREIPQPGGVADFLSNQRQSDGGYLEIRAAKRAGVNPTAAAIGTLRCIGQLPQPSDSSGHLLGVDVAATSEFLLERQNGDGGFSANTRIPFSDLLSTFTAIWTLTDLGVTVSDETLVSARRYAAMMAGDGSGGFVGFELDEVRDVEYTFYGLGVMSLCAAANEV